ncbi:MAG: VacB/RNase II family 3'-5' exoribonuclease [Alphaproteobacteria bacterium]|nr:VacB/RNase II family 3'-5' exoribonuclease [Alphaproteobacteria bacterium]
MRKGHLRRFTGKDVLKKHGYRKNRSATLPPVAVIEICSRDPEGHFIAQPQKWDSEREEPFPHILVRNHGKNNSMISIGSRALAKLERQKNLSSSGALIYQASVIKLLTQKKEAALYVFRITNEGQSYIEPVDRKLSRIYPIKNEIANDIRHNELISVAISDRKREEQRQIRVLKRHEIIDSERSLPYIAIRSYDIPHEFTAETLSEADAAQHAIHDKNRQDLRHLPFVTIDPEDARDHDDAVWSETDTDPRNPGGVIIMVAIADVAYYVREGSALDREALIRGNSIYFPGYVIPMLPERISNDLCSLRSGEDRPVLVVRMVFDVRGCKTTHQFIRAIIKSIATLPYEKAQAVIDGKEKANPVDDPRLEMSLIALSEAYKILTRGRQTRMPLELEIPERKLFLNDDGSICRIIIPPRLEAHRLIEEFMIQANVAAAETLETKNSPLLYRVHKPPSRLKLETLEIFLKNLNLKKIEEKRPDPCHFNALLTQVKNTEYDLPVSQIILRTQSQAEYSTVNEGHFGLSLASYAHFTSPIRRYSDLVVHRALIRALNLGDDGLQDQQMERLKDISSVLSITERRTAAAERDTMDRLIAHYLSNQIGSSFDASISGVIGSGLFVRLLDTDADGFVPKGRLGHEYFHYDELQQALISKSGYTTYRIGDRVVVQLVEAAPLAGKLRFDLLKKEKKKSKKDPKSLKIHH